MSYSNCRQGGAHEDCNGYVGPLDTYVCHCSCHDKHQPESAGGTSKTATE